MTFKLHTEWVPQHKPDKDFISAVKGLDFIFYTISTEFKACKKTENLNSYQFIFMIKKEYYDGVHIENSGTDKFSLMNDFVIKYSINTKEKFYETLIKHFDDMKKFVTTIPHIKRQYFYQIKNQFAKELYNLGYIKHVEKVHTSFGTLVRFYLVSKESEYQFYLKEEECYFINQKIKTSDVGYDKKIYSVNDYDESFNKFKPLMRPELREELFAYIGIES